MASVGLKSVGKIFPNGHAAVHDVTLDVADRELLVLLGPSGCGKSTVLRLIAGLETPTSGQVLIGGRDVTRVPPQQRDLAMVFQSYALYPHKSVRENLAFGLRLRKVPHARIEERVRATAAALGISGLLDRKPAALSGGERQRVALGRAIVREPQAFLLDEPLSNLDPLLRVATRAELALLHRRLAATMVYVTHDQEEAMTLGDRIAVMRQGRLEQVAAPLDVYRRPGSAFVARFVGTPAMNLWRATVRRRGEATLAVSACCTLGLAPDTVDAPEGSALLIGIRPHDLDSVALEDGDLTGTVDVVEPLGATTVVHVRLPDQREERVRAVVSADSRFAVGDRASFRLRRDRLHVFDGRTEVRISATALPGAIPADSLPDPGD